MKVSLNPAELAFVAETLGAEWADDVKYGSGSALLPIMSEIANLDEDGGEIEISSRTLRGIGVVDLVHSLNIYNPAPYLDDDERNALIAKLSGGTNV